TACVKERAGPERVEPRAERPEPAAEGVEASAAQRERRQDVVLVEAHALVHDAALRGALGLVPDAQRVREEERVVERVERPQRAEVVEPEAVVEEQRPGAEADPAVAQRERE